MKIIKFEKNKMKLLINKPKKSNENAKFFIFVIRNLKINMLRTKNITNLRTLPIIQVNIQFQQKKKIKELIKREKGPQKPYLTDYKLLTV